MFCIGGSNDAIEYAGHIDEPDWNRLFQQDPETRVAYADFRTELYFKDKCPLWLRLPSRYRDVAGSADLIEIDSAKDST